MKNTTWKEERRTYVGGSDARIIMGDDEKALVRLWQEKRGEIAPEDLSGNLIVQLGSVTEDLNRRWYILNTGQVICDIQRHVKHPAIECRRHPADGGMLDVPLDVANDLPGIEFIPAAVKVFGDGAQLDDQIAGKVLGLGFTSLLPP